MLEGIDISSVNGQIDFAQVKAAGVSFVYIKSSEGDGYTNPLFAQSVQAAKAAGLLWGPYHFYRHDVDPASQAAHYLAVLQTVGTPDIPPMIDVEQPGDGAGAYSYGKAEVVRRVGVVVDAVQQALGVAPGIYTYGSAWLALTGNSNAFAQRCPLWLANYNASVGTPPGGWSQYTILQYTSTGRVPGIAGVVDRDRFPGTLEQFQGLMHPSNVRHFPETGYDVRDGFRILWEQYGLAVCGFPLENEHTDADGMTRQILENVRFEWAPGQACRIGAMGRDYLALLGAHS